MLMKQNVNIILKLIFGHSILILLGLLLTTSCVGIKSYREHNYINGSEFYNDSLSISAVFFGDMKFYPITKKEPILNLQKERHLRKRNLLFYGKAYDPEYEVFLFYREKSNIKPSEDTLLLNDDENQKVAYKKSTQGKEITLLLRNTEKYKQGKKNKTLLLDGKKLINSVRFDSYRKDELTYMKIFNNYQNEDNILYVSNKFNTAPIENSKQNDWMKFQLLTTVLSKDPDFRDYQELINEFELNKKTRLSDVIERFLREKTNWYKSDSDALNEIADLSKNEQVVMLNELHWLPKHRILASKLLRPLKEAGYNYFAVEGVFLEKDSLLNENKFPVKSTGYYTNEPYFGLLLRKALKLGYEVVAYDDFDKNNREEAQALNIKKIFDKDPDAKVFVYAGIDHVLEHNPSLKRMAEYFKELSGIDPLTINQAEIIGDTKKNIILFKADSFSKIERINTNVDYFIINNIKPTLTEFFQKKEITSFVFQDHALREYNNKNVYVAVFFQHEYLRYSTHSVPLQSRILKVKNNEIQLDLPVGKYQILIKDINNNAIISKQIEVKK